MAEERGNIATITKQDVGRTQGDLEFLSSIEDIMDDAIGNKISDVFINQGKDFYHGYTYSGHPVACAVAVENLRIIKEEGMLENVKNNTAPYLQKRIREFKDHPLVGEVRGQGLLAGVELVKNKEKKELFDPAGKVGNICRDHCTKNNLVMRAVRDGMMFSPPLTITKNDIDKAMERLKISLDATLREIKDLGIY